MVFNDDGRIELSKWLGGESSTAPTHIAFGTGTNTATIADSSLQTELDRKAISTTTRSGQEVTFEVIIPSTEQDGESITEYGLLNAASSGTLFTRDVFSAINKTLNFDIQIDITLRVK